MSSTLSEGPVNGAVERPVAQYSVVPVTAKKKPRLDMIYCTVNARVLVFSRLLPRLAATAPAIEYYAEVLLL